MNRIPRSVAKKDQSSVGFWRFSGRVLAAFAHDWLIDAWTQIVIVGLGAFAAIVYQALNHEKASWETADAVKVLCISVVVGLAVLGLVHGVRAPWKLYRDAEHRAIAAEVGVEQLRESRPDFEVTIASEGPATQQTQYGFMAATTWLIVIANNGAKATFQVFIEVEGKRERVLFERSGQIEAMILCGGDERVRIGQVCAWPNNGIVGYMSIYAALPTGRVVSVMSWHNQLAESLLNPEDSKPPETQLRITVISDPHREGDVWHRDYVFSDSGLKEVG